MKKLLSKVLSVLIAAILAASVLCLGVYAESGSCTLVQKSSADEGGTFTVDVVLSDNPGISTLSCNVRFDYEDVEFVSVAETDLLSGFYQVKVGNVVQLSWMGNGSDVTVNGVVATITFKALTSDAGGSMIYNTVTAYNSGRISVPIDGGTTIVRFGQGAVATEPEPTEPEPRRLRSSRKRTPR